MLINDKNRFLELFLYTIKSHTSCLSEPNCLIIYEIIVFPYFFFFANVPLEISYDCICDTKHKVDVSNGFFDMFHQWYQHLLLFKSTIVQNSVTMKYKLIFNDVLYLHRSCLPKWPLTTWNNHLFHFMNYWYLSIRQSLEYTDHNAVL